MGGKLCEKNCNKEKLIMGKQIVLKTCTISLKSTFICKNIYLLTKMLCYVKNILRTKVIVNAKYLKESRALVVKTPKCISFDNSYLIKFDQIVCSDWKKNNEN